MKLKKTLFAVLFMVAVLLLVSAVSSFSQEQETGRKIKKKDQGIQQNDNSIIDTAVFNHLERPAVMFDHDDHNEKAGLDDNCAVCHHVYEDKKLVEDESSEDQNCSECHLLTGSKENPVPLKLAFHKRCIQCHFKSKKGPVLCGECHLKK